MRSKFFPALAVLVGTTMGAGFLAIPYVISKSGFLPGIAWLIFVALFMLFVKLYLGEISLRTRGNHQLTGYAEMYLGKKGKLLMFFAMLFGVYSALAAYLVAEGQVLSFVFMGNENYSFVFSIVFWFIMTLLVYKWLSGLKKAEKIGMVLVWIFIALILVIFSSGIKTDNLSYVNLKSVFMPFGVILFSFLAFSAMPEVERILFHQEKLMKKVIIFGTLIPLLAYFLFTLIVVGNFGINVPEIATLTLPRFFSFIAVLTMFTAFFTLSIAIRDMFMLDYNIRRLKAWLLACFVPLGLFFVIYFFNLASFIILLSISGIVSGGLTGILILLMNRNAKIKGDRKPEYSVPINWLIIAALSVVFILAVIAEFVF